MTETNDSQSTPEQSGDDFEKTLEVKSRRKASARKAGKQSPWFGLGMFGVIGWSIALPTVVGVFVGSWIDSHWASRVSWKLTFLFLGAIVGCAIAAYWLQKEMVE